MTNPTPIETLLTKLEEARAKATPDNFQLRCREFSNHARSEIWTEMGWLDQLPKSYREPTVEHLVLSHNTTPALIEAFREVLGALHTILLRDSANPQSGPNLEWHRDWRHRTKDAAREALARANEIASQALGETKS